jgi:ribonuclease-3
VVRLFEDLVSSPQLLVLGRDAKSELQEYLSLHGQPQPEYLLMEESGPAHDRRFVFQIQVGDRVVGAGQGKSKKIAQQAAAATALVILQSANGRLV